MKGLPCPPEHWSDFSALLDEALAQPAETRERWLEALPAAKAHLRGWLADVLRADARARTDDYLARLKLPGDVDAQGTFAAGQPVGPYRLEAPLGRGGMGEVWSAQRVDGALDRTVALKLPRADLMTLALRSRIARERDILASLTHPHIAQLYDAGVTAQGQPYLALERVEGRPIDAHCLERTLGLDARIGLFLQVLDAVGFAHRHLVVHRDLKPSNIFVTQDAAVKLLDFGIAKLLDEPGGDANETELTRLSGRAMTPEYAAPEQIAGEAVSVATDVFSLGVVLFQLLAGQRPFGRERPDEAPLLSTRVDPEQAAQCGLASTRALKHALEGDLDAIVACCLGYAPDQRYASVDQFAEDLRRHLHDEPIRARHIGRAERTWKFIRRNRVPTTLGAGLALALVVGMAGVLWQARRADAAARESAEQARIAQSEARRANAAKTFLTNVLTGGDPHVARDVPLRDRTARELLDAAADRIDHDFRDAPDLQIEVLELTTRIYSGLGDEERFRSIMARYVDKARAHYGPAHPTTLSALLAEAGYAEWRQDRARAAVILDEVDAALRVSNQDRSLVRADWLHLKARQHYTTTGDLRAMGRLFDQAIALYEAQAPHSEKFAALLGEAAFVHDAFDEYEQVRALSQRALAIYESLPARNDANVGVLLENYGQCLEWLGDFDGANAAFARSVELAHKTMGEGSPNYWTALVRRAALLHGHGDRAGAHALFDTMLRAIPADWSVNVEDELARAQYARRLAAEGRAEQAIPILERTLQVAGKAYSSTERIYRMELGNAYDLAGRTGEARQMMAQARQMSLADEPPDSRAVALVEERWARFLLDHAAPGSSDLDEAERGFRRALTIRGGAPSSVPTLAHLGLAGVALARNDVQGALQESAAAITAMGQIRELYDIRLQPKVWLVRSRALLASGDRGGAARWAQQALEARLRYDDPSSPTITAARAAVLAATGGIPVVLLGVPEPKLIGLSTEPAYRSRRGRGSAVSGVR